MKTGEMATKDSNSILPYGQHLITFNFSTSEIAITVTINLVNATLIGKLIISLGQSLRSGITVAKG